MSSKIGIQPKPEQSSVKKIALMEPIVTRNQSAQYKRQLREKDRTMTNITKLLKRQTKVTSPKSPKQNKSPKSKTQPEVKKNPPKALSILSKRQLIDEHNTQEFYPDKIKRAVKNQKISLRPISQLKKVAGLSKRKMRTPLKDIKTPFLEQLILNSESSKESSYMKLKKAFNEGCTFDGLSIAELIHYTEEFGTITDEDFMDILTCPSPVWWEDPPDNNKDSTSLQESTKEDATGNTPSNSTTETSAETDADLNLDLDVKCKGEAFIQKRSKLENVLGNIKQSFNNEYSRIQYLEDDLAEIKKIESTNVEVEERFGKRSNASSKGTSESSDVGDLCFGKKEEEILKELDNIVIPVEGKNKKHDIVVIDDDDDITNPQLRSTFLASGKDNHDKDPVRNLTKSNKVKLKKPHNKKCLINYECSDNAVIIIDDDKNAAKAIEVKGDLIPKNDKNVFLRYFNLVPLNCEEITRTKKSRSQLFLNLRSGRTPKNINFVRKARKSKAVSKIEEEVKENSCNNSKDNLEQNAESFESIVTKNDSDTVKLKTYYKSCKSIIRKIYKEHTNNNNLQRNIYNQKKNIIDPKSCGSCSPTRQSIVVGQDSRVKYCLKCSSIFDTQDCMYCVKNLGKNTFKQNSCNNEMTDRDKISVES